MSTSTAVSTSVALVDLRSSGSILGVAVGVVVSVAAAVLDVPLLYIAGRRDRLVRAAVMTQMKHLRPDMETRVLDAPHLVLQRRPVEVGELISEFIHRHHT